MNCATGRIVAIDRGRKCAADGCPHLAFGGRYCEKCAEQAEWLDRAMAAPDPRESRAAMRWFRVRSAARRWLWIPATLGVLAFLVYMAFLFCTDAGGWISEGRFQ